MNDFQFYDGFFFGGKGCKNPEKRVLFKKAWTGRNVLYNLLDLLVGRFEYELPESCDARFLELCLLYNNTAAIASIDGKPMNLSISGAYNISPYGYPSAFNLVDYMGRNYGRFVPDAPGNESFADCVYVRNSKMNQPPIYRILWYADRLTELQTSISAAIANLRGTVIVRCSTKEQEGPVKRAWMNAGNGLPVIFSFTRQEGLDAPAPDVITNPQTASILRDLQENYDKTYAQFCEEFGINGNAVVNKMSGVSNLELSQNLQGTNIRLRESLAMREDAMKRAAAKFGVPFSVRLAFDPDVLDRDDETFDETGEEGKDDEMV